MLPLKAKSGKLFWCSFCLHMGIEVQKSALPTLFNIARVRAASQPHVYDMYPKMGFIMLVLFCENWKSRKWKDLSRKGRYYLNFKFWNEVYHSKDIFALFLQEYFLRNQKKPAVLFITVYLATLLAVAWPVPARLRPQGGVTVAPVRTLWLQWPQK